MFVCFVLGERGGWAHWPLKTHRLSIFEYRDHTQLGPVGFIPVFLFCLLTSISFSTTASPWSHALSMYGDFKYPKTFTHFEYANPNAPKGGRFKQATIGSFDSLNPFIVKGNAASGAGMIYDSLLKQSSDEPFTGYALIASGVKIAPDFSSVSFKINPNARFHDGKKKTNFAAEPPQRQISANTKPNFDTRTA